MESSCILNPQESTQSHHEIRTSSIQHSPFFKKRITSNSIKSSVTSNKKNMYKMPFRWYCQVCNLILTSKVQTQEHFFGKKHQNVIRSKSFYNQQFYTKLQMEKQRTCKYVTETNVFKHYGIIPGLGTGIPEQHLNAEYQNCIFGPLSITKKRQMYQLPVVLWSYEFKKCLVLDGIHNPSKSFERNSEAGHGICDSDNVIPPPAGRDNILETVLKSEKKTFYSSDLSIYRTPSGKYYCQPCNITLNSQAQFLQHSESRKHKQKVSRASFRIK